VSFVLLLDDAYCQEYNFALQASYTWKLYIEDKVSDYVGWIKNFETWFEHRGDAEGTELSDKMKVVSIMVCSRLETST